MTSRPVPLIAPLAVCALLVTTALVMTLQGLALAGDGSYYLVRILGTENVFGPDPRVLANLVRQAPVLIAAAAGLTDTHLLTQLHGGGQLVVPALGWSAAVLLTRADRLAFAAVSLTAGLCAATTWFFNVSESVLAVPLTVLVAVLLWQPRAWRWGEAVVALAASAILVASYETAALTGAVLAAWAIWRARSARSRSDRIGCALVAAASILSILVAIAGVNAGPGPTNAQSFLYFVLSLDPRPFYVALGGIAVLVLAVAIVHARVARWVLLAIGGTALAFGSAALETTTVSAFEARGGASIAGLLVSLLLWCQWIQRGRGVRAPMGADTPGWFAWVPVVVGVALVATALHASTKWERNLDAFEREVDEASGVVLAEDVLPAGRRAALWDWTASSLSLIVRRDRDGAILVDRDPSYVPFAPSDARSQLPDEYVWRR